MSLIHIENINVKESMFSLIVVVGLMFCVMIFCGIVLLHSIKNKR